MFKWQNTVLHCAAAKMKANWCCTTCGMYSSRRSSVERHVKNLHKGQRIAIPFIEYLVARRNGLYPPGQRPAYGASTKASLQEKMEEEAENVFVRRVAEESFPPSGDPSYGETAKMLKFNILRRMQSNF
jgi:hypothetical protein